MRISETNNDKEVWICVSHQDQNKAVLMRTSKYFKQKKNFILFHLSTHLIQFKFDFVSCDELDTRT